jgi:predicted N-formylglutamate amidohydrolase
MMADYIVITCEHGGNRIPARYQYLFQTPEYRLLLDSHRGFDPGALLMARELAAPLSAPLVASTTSRLLVDLNRSLNHPQLHSPATRAAPAEVRRQIVEHYYQPYRAEAGMLVEQAVESGQRVIHISCHSFTPELDGQVRDADIGLLYDPARAGEADFCRRWQASLKACAPALKVRRNYPYEGKNDGFTKTLRRRFPPEAYVGMELEINQAHVCKAGRDWANLRGKIRESLKLALAHALDRGSGLRPRQTPRIAAGNRSHGMD